MLNNFLSGFSDRVADYLSDSFRQNLRTSLDNFLGNDCEDEDESPPGPPPVNFLVSMMRGEQANGRRMPDPVSERAPSVNSNRNSNDFNRVRRNNSQGAQRVRQSNPMGQLNKRSNSCIKNKDFGEREKCSTFSNQPSGAPREESKEDPKVDKVEVGQNISDHREEVQQRYKEVTQNWIIEPHKLDLIDDNIKEMAETFDKACYEQEQGTEFISLLHSVLTGTPNFSSDKICKLTLKLHESCIKKQLGTDRDKMASTHLEELISFPSKESFAKLEGYLYSAKQEVKI